MPRTFVKPGESFESAFRRFKRLIEKSGYLTRARRGRFHEPKSAKRKREKAAARKRLMKRLARENAHLLPRQHGRREI